ncbi:hypothetical protein ACS3SW_15615 [Roseobacteraceae bacterium S113]
MQEVEFGSEIESGKLIDRICDTLMALKHDIDSLEDVASELFLLKSDLGSTQIQTLQNFDRLQQTVDCVCKTLSLLKKCQGTCWISKAELESAIHLEVIRDSILAEK